MGQSKRTGRPSAAEQGNGPGAGTSGDEMGFEDALERLGRVVEALESGDLGLDAALLRYEEGVRLLGRCRSLLDTAERRVALLTGVDDDGTPHTEPFDAQATVDSPRAGAGRAATPPRSAIERAADADGTVPFDDAPF